MSAGRRVSGVSGVRLRCCETILIGSLLLCSGWLPGDALAVGLPQASPIVLSMARTHQWPTWELETEFQPAGATAVPRSLAAAVSPMLSGALLAISTFGWPVIFAGGLKMPTTCSCSSSIARSPSSRTYSALCPLMALSGHFWTASLLQRLLMTQSRPNQDRLALSHAWVRL